MRNALFANGGTVDQVIAKAPGVGDPAANVQNSTIRNSIVVASGANGHALLTDGGNVNTSTYRNVTAIATASGGVAIGAYASNVTGKTTIHLVNVLAYGDPSGISLKAQTDNSGAQATITVTHSNYQSGLSDGAGALLVDGGGNATLG